MILSCIVLRATIPPLVLHAEGSAKTGQHQFGGGKQEDDMTTIRGNNINWKMAMKTT